MRNQDWHEGRRNGIKWAVAFVHAYAGQMNDPSARAALNTCASSMGAEAKDPTRRVPGMEWELSDKAKEQISEIDQCLRLAQRLR
jgi:hypothetical protein